MLHATIAKTNGFLTSTTLLVPGTVNEFIDMRRRAPLVVDDIRQAASYLAWSIEQELEEIEPLARTGNHDALVRYRGLIQAAELLAELIRDRVGAWTRRS